LASRKGKSNGNGNTDLGGGHNGAANNQLDFGRQQSPNASTA
jgi:hypothetical protein